MKLNRKALLSIFAGALVLSATPSATTAATYNPPVPGDHVMRLISPAPTAANSVNLTADANGSWDQYYGKGLRAFHMYADVRGEVSLTYKYTTAQGAPLQNRTVYLIVNKRGSCSETTFFTPQATDYPGYNRPNSNTIVRDWCGDQPQLGAGETAIIAKTDAFGNATFNMTNYNVMGEMFPKAPNVMNLYSEGISCADDTMCLSTTIAPSLVAHPNEAQDRREDKDLLLLHFVNPKVTAVKPTRTAKSGKAQKIVFTLTDLYGKPVIGKTVTFDSWGEGDELNVWSKKSNGLGQVAIYVTAPKKTVGLQVVRAYIYGAPKGTNSKIYWKK